jgi:hypothetical protein
MDNKDNCNKTSNELELDCGNNEKLKVDEQIKLQKKITEQVKSEDSPSTSTNYEHNEGDRKLQRKSAIHDKQKGVSMFATKKKSFGSSSQLRLDTYKKRSGIVDQGKEYEKLMALY